MANTRYIRQGQVLKGATDEDRSPLSDHMEVTPRFRGFYSLIGHVYCGTVMLENSKPKPGDRVVLTGIPPGLLDGLPSEDQQAIDEIVGKPILLNGYEEDGRAELEFKDGAGSFHFVYVRPEFIRKVL